MEPYVIRVASSDDPDRAADPSVYSAVTAGVECLFDEIRRNIVRAELCL